MSSSHPASPSRIRRFAAVAGLRRPAAASAVALSLVLVAGCGGSSKPAYCSSVANLKTSVQDLSNVNVVQNGLTSVKSAVQKIQSDAKTVVSSAKTDFPSQTSAMETSVNALVNTAKQLSASPSPAALATMASEATASVTAIKNFTSATSSKCG